jgi:methyl-accepting chemotaxis protein
MDSFFENAANGMGLGKEEAANMKLYAKHLLEVSKNSNELSESLASDADSAADLAVEITRMNKGVNTLADNFDDWNDILTKSSETSAEYAEAMIGMKTAVADVMDVEADLVSNDFVKDHLDDIKAAATGDAEAIDRLRASMDEEIIANITLGQTDEFIANVNELSTKVQDIAAGFPDIEVGAIL